MKTPFEFFGEWFNEAREASVPQLEAMVLITATLQAKPSARMVLLKGIEDGRFRFFTNYESRKAQELDENPQAQLLFYWPTLGKQIRIEGRVQRTSSSISDDYFSTRSRESRIGAIASSQSRPLSSMDELRKKVASVEKNFPNPDVPRPPNWGGYELVPHYFEFWKDGENRLHERITFTEEKGKWTSSRLWP